MVARMELTVSIADVLVAEARRVAADAGSTLDELVEDVLRRELVERRDRKPFKLRDGSVDGLGLTPEFATASWDEIIAASYERDHT